MSFTAAGWIGLIRAKHEKAIAALIDAGPCTSGEPKIEQGASLLVPRS